MQEDARRTLNSRIESTSRLCRASGYLQFSRPTFSSSSFPRACRKHRDGL